MGEQPGLHPGDLALRHGVTRGAVSQMVSRLCGKGFLERRASDSSLAEGALFLTPTGELAFRGHEEYHARQGAVWEAALAGLSEADMTAVAKFLAAVEDILDTEVEEKQ